jgi:hypothetical protein
MSERARLRIWIPIAVGALVIGGLWAGSSRPPRLPADADHAPAQAESHCLCCHGYGQRQPRPADHPPRDDCFSCHKNATGLLHPRQGAPTSIPGGWADDPRRR